MHPDKIERILNACLFLATKVIEVNFNTEAFCGRFQIDPRVADLAGCEMILSKELNYQFAVHTPFESVNSILYRLEDVIRM